MELFERIKAFAQDQPDRVVGLRLSSGESVLAIVEHVDEATILVKKPILYVMQGGQLGFSSWICNGKSGVTQIPVEAVTIFHEVEEEVRDNYLQVVDEKRIQKASGGVTKLVNESGRPLND